MELPLALRPPAAALGGGGGAQWESPPHWPRLPPQRKAGSLRDSAGGVPRQHKGASGPNLLSTHKQIPIVNRNSCGACPQNQTPWSTKPFPRGFSTLLQSLESLY